MRSDPVCRSRPRSWHWALRPIATPWGLMGTAVATGAVLTLARPWRWLFRPGLLLAVASPLVSELASRWLHQAVSGVAAGPPSMAPDTDPRLPKAPLQ